MPITIPPNLMEQLTFFCDTHDLGLAEIGNQSYRILLLAENTLSPDQAAILAAHGLLTGVINGVTGKSNRESIVRQEERNKPQ